MFFFFQAEDGIRDVAVTGVQTCALPIYVGDVILTWNGGEPPRRMGRWVYEQKPGDVLRLKVRRDEHEISLEFLLGEMKETVYGVFEDPGASEKARNIREGLLRGETASARRR